MLVPADSTGTVTIDAANPAKAPKKWRRFIYFCSNSFCAAIVGEASFCSVNISSAI
jgi:hypothetical protein